MIKIMNAFYTLPAVLRSAFAILLFAALLGETALFIYRKYRAARLIERIISLMFAVVMLLSMILFWYDGDTGTGLCRLPWIIAAALILVSAFHLATAVSIEIKRLSERLTPNSIREATNAFTLGICFADPMGRIILCNDTMRELAYMMTGSYPQLIDELDAVLVPKNADDKNSPERMYFFPDGSVRQFNTGKITVGGEEGWRQMTAQDVTELYHVREKLENENQQLAETNRRLHAMYERMTDDIREKESLEMKIRVHDTMGRSLITIQNIMENPIEAEEKLAELEEAISVLSSAPPRTSVDEERQNCEKLGVRLILRGYIPKGTRIEKIVIAAIRECATNCVKHAHGTYIAVDIQERYGIYSITITNDGDVPKEKITEGSGLSSLRRSVESSGGEMLTAYSPRFALLINLPAVEEDI